MHDAPSLTRAEELLAARMGAPVRLGEPDPLDSSGRSHVLRVPVLDGPSGAPASVIMKRAGGSAEQPYDPSDAKRWSPAWRFFNDWAGAEFLTLACPEAPVSPRFLGGDRAQGFILLEDLGAGESVADLLLGSDPSRARMGLVGIAAALGRMHAATAGRADEYRALRAGLGQPAEAEHDPVEIAGELAKIAEPCGELGVPLTPAVEEEVVRAARQMADPGPFECYTHGDACPDNNRVLGREARLIDFEFGRARHALLDGVYGRVPFPTCWCVNRIYVAREMENVYRKELARGVPQAADDRMFRAAAAAACAQWLIWTTGGSLAEALVENRQWGEATMRQRLAYRFELFAETAAELGHFPALGEFSAALAAALWERWGVEAEMPPYRAFRV